MFRDFLSPIFYDQFFAHPNKSSIFADMKQEIIDKINRLASQDESFLFVINYQKNASSILKEEETFLMPGKRL